MNSQAAKLIRLLGSDQDGEVLVAARKLGKALANNNKDWHWLATLVEANLSAKAVSPIEAAIHAYGAASAAKPSPKPKSDWEEFDLDLNSTTLTIEIIRRSTTGFKIRNRGSASTGVWVVGKEISINNLWRRGNKQYASITIAKALAEKLKLFEETGDERHYDDEEEYNR